LRATTQTLGFCSLGPTGRRIVPDINIQNADTAARDTGFAAANAGGAGDVGFLDGCGGGHGGII